MFHYLGVFIFFIQLKFVLWELLSSDPQMSNRGRWLLGQFVFAKLKDKDYNINEPSFYTTLQKKKEIGDPSF